MEIVPCSHVGHVFRDKSPYSFPGGVSKIVLHNANRVAEVWMDEWRDFYYAMNPGWFFVFRFIFRYIDGLIGVLPGLSTEWFFVLLYVCSGEGFFFFL